MAAPAAGLLLPQIPLAVADRARFFISWLRRFAPLIHQDRAYCDAQRGTLAAVAAALLLAFQLSASQGATMSGPYFSGPDAALEAAIRANDRAAVAAALRSGANVNARGKQNVTPLMVAVDLGKLAAVTELLAHMANPNDKAIDGASPVSLAVENYKRQPDILLAVMKGGGDPNILRPNGDPVIIRFVNDRNCDLIRLMKEFGANLNARSRTKDPLVIDAALASDWDAVLCLMELGANYRYEDSPYSLSKLLADPYPGPGSSMYPYKKQVADHLRANGIAVPPME
jgi:ankyrin repeat protein